MAWPHTRNRGNEDIKKGVRSTFLRKEHVGRLGTMWLSHRLEIADRKNFGKKIDLLLSVHRPV
jgi:hypothetical protein